MRLLCAGLSRTGTTSLHKAVQMLGFTSIHYDFDRLRWAVRGQPGDFRVYDDVDVVTDIPSALFFAELADAYPEAMILLTHRDEDDWWDSVQRHIAGRPALSTMSAAQKLYRLVRKGPKRYQRLRFVDEVRIAAYGSTTLVEAEWRRRYRDHNARVRATIPPNRLVEMDVAEAGWEPLCHALGVERPAAAYPHANRR